MKRKIQVPSMMLRASITPKSFNAEQRTIQVVASTGARVKRNTYFGFGEDFFEELDMKKSSIRMDRLKSGAPLLDSHGLAGERGIRGVMGVVESARLEDGMLIADVRFSEREEFKSIIRDVEAGIIRNISVGYQVHKFKEMPDADGIKVLRAVDWEPYELSLVPVGADGGAGTRNFDKVERFDCEVTLEERGEVMPENQEQGKAPEGSGNSTRTNEGDSTVSKPVAFDEVAVRKQAVEVERLRCKEIRMAVTQAKLGAELADDLIERGVTADQARTEVLAKLAEADKKDQTRSTSPAVGEDLAKVGFRKGVENAILCRIKPGKFQIDECGKEFRYASMMDMVKRMLQTRGINPNHLSPMEIATRGLHSTSDFPEILANVLSKTLRSAYEESPQTFRPFTRYVTAQDFKQISRVSLGDAPKLKEKLETGEYEYGTMSESAEKYSVKSYGRVIGLSREALVNDDLNAFARLPEMYGRQAANLESDLVWAIITSNPTMADGFALFSSQHGNLAGAGAAPSLTTLGAAREAMRLQTSLDGSYLNIVPKFLMVPANHETTADQLTTSITPAVAANVNSFGPQGKTPLISNAEPRLDANSVNAWYLMADIGQIDILELARLAGEEGPVVDSMIDFDTDGVKFKARHSVGVKAIDFRGVYKNPGV